MTAQRHTYQGWAVAGLIVCGLLSILALGLAVMLVYLLAFTAGGDGLYRPGEAALFAFYLVAAALPFWGVRLFWRLMKLHWDGDRDPGLSRSAWRLGLAIIGVTAVVNGLWMVLAGSQTEDIIGVIAVHWGIVLPPIVILIILTRIVSPIGREEQVAHVF